MINNLPQPIKDLGKAALSKVADKFVDFVITKYTGKSIKVFEVEGDIDADKVRTKWELLEKPFWLQAEAIKMGRQYSNFGNTLLKAAPIITATDNKIADDNDVFCGFLEHSKEISNEEMQELIAKIIAGEYNAPGTYSMSTLQVIKMLGKSELELFERMCSLLISSDQIPQDLFSLPENAKGFMKKLVIDFGSLQLLQSLGLFLPNSMTKSLENLEKKNFKTVYFDKNILFTPIAPENENTLKISMPGSFGLSPVGKQLLKHLTPKYNDEYFVWLKENYKIPNYKILE
ncbi:MAG: membrane-fusion protein [uncultured bacterium]|nr:MAG: membrane-fusion protein [uncultured bacterium]